MNSQWKFDSFLAAILFAVAIFASSFSSSFAAAGEVCDSKTVDGYVQILKNTGTNARSPSLEELFDAMNSSKTLMNDLLWVEGRTNQPLVYIEVPGKPPVYYNFRSIPKKGKGDPRCKDKTVTGYECRLNQLRDDEETGGMPNGMKTGVQIKVPVADAELVARISNAFGCNEIVEESGNPVLPAAKLSSPEASANPANAELKANGKPRMIKQPELGGKPAAAKAAPATAPSTQPKSNIIPRNQLQSAPVVK